MAIRTSRERVKTSVQLPQDLIAAWHASKCSLAELIEAGLQNLGYQTRTEVLTEAWSWHVLAERLRVLRQAQKDLREVLAEVSPEDPRAQEARAVLSDTEEILPDRGPNQRHAPVTPPPAIRDLERIREELDREQATRIAAVSAARRLATARSAKDSSTEEPA